MAFQNPDDEVPLSLCSLGWQGEEITTPACEPGLFRGSFSLKPTSCIAESDKTCKHTDSFSRHTTTTKHQQLSSAKILIIDQWPHRIRTFDTESNFGLVPCLRRLTSLSQSARFVDTRTLEKSSLSDVQQHSNHFRPVYDNFRYFIVLEVANKG